MVLDASFTEVAYLESWLKLRYRLALNEPTRCALDLALDDPKIAQCSAMRYLRVLRDSVNVWLGRVQMSGWMHDEANAASNTYPLDAWDMIAELGGRTLPRPAGMDFNERTGPADDVLKAYVYYEAGAGAIAARRVNGLTVAADLGAVANVTKLWLGGTLLEHMQRLGKERSFYWGLVPTYAVGGALTGMEYRTAYPLWGLDKSKGNAGEIVLAEDNHNIKTVAYKFDLTDHVNHVYVAGPGEDRNQQVVEAEDAAAVAAYGRREAWITSDNITTAGLTEDGETYLAQHRAVEQLIAVVLPGVIGPEHLGYKVTVFDHRYGRTEQQDCVITAINVSVGDDGVETLTPELTVSA
jgi:hypothetical protein